MPSLVTLRPCAGPPHPPWAAIAAPHAYSEAAKIQFKAVPGIRWHADPAAPNGRGVWVGSRDAIEAVCAQLEASRIAHVQCETPSGRLVDDRSWLGVAPSPPREFSARLRQYQIEGAQWLVDQLRASGAALLADEMGLGKSAQAIATIDALGAERMTLVICPAIVRPHWHGQIARWCNPKLSEPVVGWGDVWSYEQTVKMVSRGLETWPYHPDVVVVDECHYLSNAKSQRSKAVRKILETAHRGQRRPHLICLSGTPMTARVRDLHNVLDLMHPGRWGSWFDFTKRYCGGHWEEIPHVDRPVWKSDGHSYEGELASRLRAVMLRRTKAEVAQDLPPLTRNVVEVELPTKVTRSLRKDADAVDWASVLTQGLGVAAGDAMSQLLAGVETFKVPAACALAHEIREASSRVLILTLRKDTAATIAGELRCPYVTGDIAPDRRRGVIADAQIAVATLHSVTTGIDLIGFDHEIMTGLDWVPSRMLQGEARIHRLGQGRACTVHYLVGLGTVDERVREVVIDRLDVLQRVAGAGDEGLQGALSGSDEDLLQQIVKGLG